ncbi:hypothetical protein [Actinokineospora globicatena]|uniref:ABC transporter n=1 Tax=Actinokineospora globicatena TaxID=103729 RepID=A0A9W6QHP0_9PSEU|nr:hypothetical protein [Actinokineospora globicatena]GLW90236.1 hypothetical protein Aglo03_10520 [Actinokineospora globicatena]
MIALIRYTLATTIHGQRYLAPVLLFCAGVGISSGSDSGPLPGVYALNSGILLVCATWLTMAVISVEDPTHRAITVVAARGPVKVLAATIAVSALFAVGLTIIGLGLPLLMNPRPITAADLPAGALAHLLCASLGLAVGLLCSRLVIRRQGYALLTALALVTAALLTTGSPPNTLFKGMANTNKATDVLPTAAALLPIGLAVLAVAAVITHVISIRRD